MRWTFERKLLAAAMLAWAVVAIVRLASDSPLGHDESAFAILARGDAPAWLYRSRGVTLLARIGVALGGAAWQLRLASAVVNLAIIPAAYAVGRTVFDARTGAWAAAVLVGAYPMVSRSAELLGDLPATAAMLAGIAVLAGELARPDGPRWRIALAAPAFAAAFYLRYASAPIIAIAGLAAAVLWWRSIRRRPWPIVATVALFGLLFVPHVVHSLDQTGEALGVLRVSASVPRRAYWGEGLVTYLTANPFAYYGALVAPILVAAIVGLAWRFRARGPWYLAVVAIGQLVAIGIHNHGQPRYVYLAVTLLVILGVETLRSLARPRLALAAVATAWLGAVIAVVIVDRVLAPDLAAVRRAGQTLRAHRTRAPCAVLAGPGPQLTWYSGCLAIVPGWDDREILDPRLDRFVVSTRHAPIDGPAYAAAHQLRITELAPGDDRARVWQVW